MQQKLSYPKIDELRLKVHHDVTSYWLNHDFLTWRWWVLLILTLIPWLIWWKLVDKERLKVILLYGLLIAVMTVVIDDIGTQAVWWSYPHKLIQVLPPLAPADLTLVPIFMMLLYQRFTQWKTFVIANLIGALFLAFGAEYIFKWLDFYKLYKWTAWYSTLFYIFSGQIAWFFVFKVQTIVSTYHS